MFAPTFSTEMTLSLAPLAAAIVVLIVSVLLPRGVVAEAILPAIAVVLLVVQVIVLLARARARRRSN